ncbi:MAG: Crp/Fnr family transcriptional regulator [Anaerolineae bacterium]
MSVSTDFLETIPLFSSLSPSELEQIQSLLTKRRFRKNEVIFLEGEPCTGLHFVRLGRVKVCKTSVQGRERILRILRAGDYCGACAIFYRGLNPVTAVALEDSSLYAMKKEDVKRLLADHPKVASSLLNHFASALQHFLSLAGRSSFGTVKSRLARALLEYAEREGHITNRGIGLNWRLTQEELAGFVGTTREVVSRSLRRLQEDGAISVERGQITVLDEERLRRIA